MQTIKRNDEFFEIDSRLPVLPLKEVVVFPYMVIPLLVGREPSLRAVQEAMMSDRYIFLTAQRDLTLEEPTRDDLYRFGVVARILQVLKLPNGLMKVLVEGIIRGRISRYLPITDHFEAKIEFIEDEELEEKQVIAVMRKAVSLFKEYVHLHSDIPDEVLLQLEQLHSPQRLAHYISSHLQREISQKQILLEEVHVVDQLMHLVEILDAECEILEIERRIDEKVRGRIQRSQKNFYLQEQIRVIQEELGESGGVDADLAILRDKIIKAKMPADVEQKAFEEFDKLRNTPAMSPESTVVRNFLDWLIALPWTRKSRDQIDLTRAAKILDEDHYGLSKPKERILEHLAVLKLVKKLKGPILCLVGPPGVGKTSLGKSIARAMRRNFVRISLGGVRDEAEIRGHRRTYIGSMPGRIIQSMKRAQTINPVFLLDEIDKMSVDFRGDPASALLEVLDPEQNKAFNDHFLEVDYDLSNVLFITTANVRANIPEPLQDRMEIIELPGYLEHEKVEIATGYLIPKLLGEHGLKPEQVSFARKGIQRIIHEYTREAGVRNLERQLAAICRKVAKKVADSKKKGQRFVITSASIPKYLGSPMFQPRSYDTSMTIGTATGLAWTAHGGDLLEIEVVVVDGKGGLTLTGKLGDVIRESAQAAFSYARRRAAELEIKGEFWKDKDIHIHFPEGAIPKDGPSAGVTIATALISALTGKPVRRDVAMTGELTLGGKVLAIGGLQEKVMAAQRYEIRTVLVPQENKNDIQDLPAPLRRGINIIPVAHMDQVLEHAISLPGNP